MKIGFYMGWNKHSLQTNRGNVLGDELLAESLCRALRKDSRVEDAQLYAPNFQPNSKLDYLIYLNSTPIIEKYAKKHVSYLQNGYGDDALNVVRKFHEYGMDGYIFFSKKLQKIHESLEGKSSCYVPFGVETDFFYPRNRDKNYEYDVSYIGNDIKGLERTNLYLKPAINYNFGLFGNWKIPRARFKIWKNFFRSVHPYQKDFEKLSKGRIKQEDVPCLYSSSKINLNCTLQACVDWDVITLRTFEVLACKGFLISDLVPEAQEKLKDCLIFTSGGDDLKSKIDYYLTRPKERDEISQAGYEYVIKYATIDARSKEILNYIESIK